MNKNNGHTNIGSQRGGLAALGATFPGREHSRRARNNQDGLAIRQTEGALCAVVCDGCSEGAASEVGARLGARWLAAHLPGLWAREVTRPEARGAAGAPEQVARLANLGLAGFLGRTFSELRERPARGRADVAAVQQLGLFTWLAAVVGPESWAVMGLGDGVFAVDGEVTLLEAGPGNTPDYVGYRLVERADLTGEPRLDAQVWAGGQTAALDSLVVATDGLAPLAQQAGEELAEGIVTPALGELAADERLLKNPSLLEKRLRVLSERGRLLDDDATLAVIRRRPRPGARPGRVTAAAGREVRS